MSPMDLNIEMGQVEKPFKPMIRVGTPVMNKNQVIIGYLILNYKADQIRNHIKPASFSPVSGLNLLNSEGYWLVNQDTSKEWGFMFEDKKEFTILNDYPAESKDIYHSSEDQLLTEEGLFTFSTVDPSALFTETTQRTWKVLSFISSEKIDAIFRDDRIFNIRINIILTVLYGLSFFFLGSYMIRKKKNEIEKEKMIEELKEALEEVKTLSGLLPVCSNCYKIRNDKGYWDQIEHYIEVHSDAQFSHSLCPSCMDELYKNEPWFNKFKDDTEDNPE